LEPLLIEDTSSNPSSRPSKATSPDRGSSRSTEGSHFDFAQTPERPEIFDAPPPPIDPNHAILDAPPPPARDVFTDFFFLAKIPDLLFLKVLFGRSDL